MNGNKLKEAGIGPFLKRERKCLVANDELKVRCFQPEIPEPSAGRFNKLNRSCNSFVR